VPSIDSHYYSTMINGRKYTVQVRRIWEAAKGLPVEIIDPRDYPEFENLMEQDAFLMFGPPSDDDGRLVVRDVMWHAERIMNADLNFPIILSPDGRLMDGNHRLMKAAITGQSIRVQTLRKWPDP